MMLAAARHARTESLLLDNFDRKLLVNSLGGDNNVWINNTHDRTISCKAYFRQENTGYSLELDYDIDSAITYMGNTTYILDYSDYTTFGFAEQVPHTAYGGFYFLLGKADLSEYRYLSFYAMGDERRGYTRKFKLEIKTPARTSSYIIEGVTNRWKRFIVPLSVFDKIVDWQNVTELTIVFNEIVTDRKGTVYFDDFYFLSSVNEPYLTSVNRETQPLAQSSVHIVPGVFVSGDISLNYRYTPERQNEIFNSESMTLEGQTGRVTGRMVTSFASQEFGESAYRTILDEDPYTEFTVAANDISIDTLQMNIERLDPLWDKITLGNIWVGYSQYLIAPAWGWKGISALGRKGDYEHATFLIKRQYNSYSLGNRSYYYIDEHRLGLIGIIDKKTAKLPASDEDSGSLDDSQEWDIRDVSIEKSFQVSGLLRFFQNMVNFELNYGYFTIDEDAVADYSSGAYPTYSHVISSPAVTDDMYEAKIFLDGIFPGSKFLLSYRDIGDDFRPEYRQEPVIFEDVTADQKGYYLKYNQWYNGYNFNISYDDIDRKSDSDYYRQVLNYGVGYLGSREMEFSISREYKRDKYVNAQLSIDRDERVESIILVLKYGLIYPLTPGVRYPLTPSITFREDRITHLSSDTDYTTHSFLFNLDYRLETDIGFSISYKTTRYGDSSWEPQGSPYDDNYFNGYINIRF
jgi:hypothetical protein